MACMHWDMIGHEHYGCSRIGISLEHAEQCLKRSFSNKNSNINGEITTIITILTTTVNVLYSCSLD